MHITAARAMLAALAALAACGLGCAGPAHAGPAHTAITEQIVSLPGADGAVVPYLLSHDDAAPPQAAAVLFVGGNGALRLLERGIPRPGSNFLLRTRALFVAQGIATAVVDAPSGMNGMSDAFRTGARHAADMGAVVADLKRRWPDVRVYLVGTSRGTLSAAHVGAALGPQVAGVVLTSSLFGPVKRGSSLAGFDFGRLRTPLLFVHHAEDGCAVTPYAAALPLAARHPLITVRGGGPPTSDACEPFSAHGFLGMEAPTVQAISRWMLGLEFPLQVP